MSTVNCDSFSKFTTQTGNDGIMFKNYHFGLKRTNKCGTQMWICTHRSCNASITTREDFIVKTSSIKPDGTHDFQQLNVHLSFINDFFVYSFHIINKS